MSAALLKSANARVRSGRIMPLVTARRWLAVAVACTSLLGGCSVGPDYQRPELPDSRTFSPAPMPAATVSAPIAGGAAQRFSVVQEIRADWWKLFGAPALDALIERAFAANPDIEAAQAALRAAQENVYAQRGFFFPTVQANYTPARTKIAGNLGGNSPGIQGDGSVIETFAGTPASEGGTPPFNGPVIYNFHTAQLTVGFVPDVFGGNRRQVEAAQAGADFQRLQLEATYITLASNVVAAAIQEALLRQQIATTREIIDTHLKSVELVHRQHKAGYASSLDVALQETALAQARQLLPALQRQFEQTRTLLRALTGAPQDSELPESFELDSLQLPEDLPLRLPSQIVERRPDVRAAEALLRAANAQVGISIADMLPQFSIDGSAGGAASHFDQMFWGSGKFFELSASLTQPLFAGGTLLHRKRAAEQELRAAAAQYRATVITAFQNVADALHAIYASADTLAATAAAERTARVSLELMRRQWSRGYIDRLALLGAEQAYYQAALDLSQARAARLGDTAALFQVLGGGWRDAAETGAAGNGG
jgi:NodT family efflux transporter outer membrane factor (OMF) lipoprotein